MTTRLLVASEYSRHMCMVTYIIVGEWLFCTRIYRYCIASELMSSDMYIAGIILMTSRAASP